MSTKTDQETSPEVYTAMESVAGALAGKDMTQEELKDLSTQIRNDPEAQSAVELITHTISGDKPRIKYSPSTGKRYAPHLEVDPETGEKLEWLED